MPISLLNRVAVYIVVACALLLSPSRSRAEEWGHEFFENKVRPLLVDNCYKCHSSEKDAKIKGGLALDSRDGLLNGGDSGPALVAGEPEKSLIIKAVRYQDENLQMPPDDKKRLTPEQIGDLEAWIKMGAPDPRTGVAAPAANTIAQQAADHWAFRPVKKPAIPRVKQTAWVKDNIDAFILAKLEAEGIAPGPIADKRTLIRRATFDLTGLPPTPKEVADFLADKSADAFAKVVDRLLGSHAYGERWARHWLDVARYADTKGYVFEEERRYPYSYTYRDYVIRAFNEDLPYNQFIVEQLAADHLPLGEDNRALAALGYLTLGRRFLNNQPDIIDDRIDVVTRGMMGLTVVCARCHDHKFDPVPTKDYYSLYGVFASSEEPEEKPLLTSAILPEKHNEYLAEWNKRVAEHADFKKSKHEETLSKLRATVGDYLLASHDIAALEDKEKADALAKERKLDLAVVRRWTKQLDEAKGKTHPILEPWINLTAFPADAFTNEVKNFVGAPPEGINPEIRKALSAEPLPANPKELAERYNVAFKTMEDAWQEGMKKSRDAKTDAPKILDNESQEELRQFVSNDGSPVNLDFEEVRRLLDVPAAQKVRALKRKIAELEATHPGAPPRAMALVDAPKPHNPRVFIRGNKNNPGPEVPRQFLEVLAGANRKPFEKGSGRLELAESIASPDNPLTARVMVNRVWLHHFGAGLVRTPSDFGLRSDPPTHPELLDYLAATFVEEGWSVKKLHRRLMLSSAYRQTAREDAKLAEVDPSNNLLWRMNRRRLELEAMRDSLLAVAGKLDRTVGGQGAEIASDSYSDRRSVYGIIERQNLPSMFRTFDFASPDSTSPSRFNTTVPQQALFMLNSPFIVDQARRFLERPEVRARDNDRERIKTMYQLAFQRPPDGEELKLGLNFVADKTHAPAETKLPIWQYGFGAFDTNSQKVTSFSKFPHFKGDSWQGGPEMPDDRIGWSALNARGGHPGNDGEHSTIRRWVAPEAAVITIRGEIGHNSKDGDGIRASIVSSRAGLLGDWRVHNRKQKVDLEKIEVEAGEIIDFVAARGADHNSDSFDWDPTIEARDESGAVLVKWNAKSDFSGRQDSWVTLNAWEKYAQALLVSNELLFID